MVFRILVVLCYHWAVIHFAFFLMIFHWLHKCKYMITGPTTIPSHVWDYFTVLLNLFDADGQNWCHFTALWDCTVVSSPASSGGWGQGQGEGGTRPQELLSARIKAGPCISTMCSFQNLWLFASVSFLSPFAKNEGLRIEQHEKHMQKDTGQWRRDVNFLKHCLFQDSCHVIELIWLFAEWSYWINDTKIN